LLDEATLESSGVQEGDVLRIQPEITAGWREETRDGLSGQA